VSAATPQQGDAPAAGPRADVAARCAAIEEAYEFMLAYAAQGLAREEPTGAGAEIRRYLQRSDAALAGLSAAIGTLVDALGVTPVEPYRDFLSVLARDASDARTAIRLALAQPSIGSQLIDNLNASIHVRALLTDLFLIDEILKSQKST
jgi:hypothetical protein